MRARVGRIIALRLALRAFFSVYRAVSGIRVARGDTINVAYKVEVE